MFSVSEGRFEATVVGGLWYTSSSMLSISDHNAGCARRSRAICSSAYLGQQHNAPGRKRSKSEASDSEADSDRTTDWQQQRTARSSGGRISGGSIIGGRIIGGRISGGNEWRRGARHPSKRQVRTLQVQAPFRE